MPANPVINDPSIAANIARVGMGAGMVWTPLHVATGPLTVERNGAAYRASVSGSMPASVLAANSELFQFRFVSSRRRVCLVLGIAMSSSVSAASTTTAQGAFYATKATVWTVQTAGGVGAVLTDPNSRVRRRLGGGSEVDKMQIASGAGLSPATKTIAATSFGSIPMSTTTAAITVGPVMTLATRASLLGDPNLAMGCPLILENQEGFIIRNSFAIDRPAWDISVDVQWLEVDYDF